MPAFEFYQLNHEPRNDEPQFFRLEDYKVDWLEGDASA